MKKPYFAHNPQPDHAECIFNGNSESTAHFLLKHAVAEAVDRTGWKSEVEHVYVNENNQRSKTDVRATPGRAIEERAERREFIRPKAYEVQMSPQAEGATIKRTKRLGDGVEHDVMWLTPRREVWADRGPCVQIVSRLPDGDQPDPSEVRVEIKLSKHDGQSVEFKTMTLEQLLQQWHSGRIYWVEGTEFVERPLVAAKSKLDGPVRDMHYAPSIDTGCRKTGGGSANPYGTGTGSGHDGGTTAAASTKRIEGHVDARCGCPRTKEQARRLGVEHSRSAAFNCMIGKACFACNEEIRRA
jgi:hypothetical protein